MGLLAQWPPSNTTWLICFATATGRLAQWPSNTTWLIWFATTTGQFDQTWRTVQNKTRSGWCTGSRSGTHFPQALINETWLCSSVVYTCDSASKGNRFSIRFIKSLLLRIFIIVFFLGPFASTSSESKVYWKCLPFWILYGFISLLHPSEAFFPGLIVHDFYASVP